MKKTIQDIQNLVAVEKNVADSATRLLQLLAEAITTTEPNITAIQALSSDIITNTAGLVEAITANTPLALDKANSVVSNPTLTQDQINFGVVPANYKAQATMNPVTLPKSVVPVTPVPPITPVEPIVHPTPAVPVMNVKPYAPAPPVQPKTNKYLNKK